MVALSRAAVLLALSCVVGVGAFKESDTAVLEHVRKAGGFVGFKIGRETEGGLRGAYADEDIAGESGLRRYSLIREGLTAAAFLK